MAKIPKGKPSQPTGPVNGLESKDNLSRLSRIKIGLKSKG
ncbi:hypothetical protein COLO4_23114 [Corchorus olitorius]|uniref:Uncharacterized protein n=1 Tax=Corchorus olitorius TaxID=93759 RepID=A0A1R3IIA6_9ROSI|nr:hypothetical protein COLO4_23114 [Corchorus olitorius]